jgi:hypothetical protein
VFTPSVATPTSSTTSSSVSTSTTATTTPPGAVRALASSPGDGVGLYGGTQNIASCDVEQLVTFLTTTDPAKGQAWATVEGIQFTELSTYIRSLTSVVLRTDTRVTNHGYFNGSATVHQSVLQAGTAVLVDHYGVPRARCYCGNPLTEPIAVPVTPVYTGDPWPGFDPGRIIVVQKSTVIINTFVLIDINTNQQYTVPAGSNGGPPTSTTTTATTTAPTTTVAPTQPVTSLGSASASSTASGGNFGPQNAIDNNPSTSWFSAGDAEGPNSSFTWAASRDVFISSVSIANNAQNATASFRSGYSFASMTVQLLDSAGHVVSQVDSPVQDRDVTVNLGAVGRTVKLLLHVHLKPGCGGFSEFVVTGHPA